MADQATKQIRTVGIVTPVYNQLTFTKKFLHSLEDLETEIDENTSLRICVVIVNNASEDGTAQFLNEYFDLLHQEGTLTESIFNFLILHNAANLGFSPAVNQGIKCLQDLYKNFDVLVTNNDMELDPECVVELCKFAHETPRAGVVGGKLRFPDGIIQHAGAFLNLFGWGQHKRGGQKLTSFYPEEKPEKCEYVTGALYYIRSDVFDYVKGFDSKYAPAYFEEVSHCYEVRKHGFEVWYCPSATAIHYENVTGKGIYQNAAEIKKQLSDRNQIKFYLEREDDTYAPSSENQLLISSKIYGEWSFCGVMRNLAKGLSRNGVDVSIAPEEYHNVSNMDDWEIKEMILKPNDYWNRAVLRSCEGDHMYLMPPGKKRIAHTTGESTRINRYWRDQLNQVDQVLTTSTFFKTVMETSGVTTHIDVLPNSVDTDLFNPFIERYPLTGLRKFNFCSMFHFGERKNPEALIRAFGMEFGQNEDVTLFIHSLSIEHVLRQQGLTISQWISKILGDKPHAPILITSSFMSDKIIPSVMSNFDTFVLPTRGEGFGLPVLEAAAMKIPSIVTGYSGVTDIVDETTGWKVDYSLVDIPLQFLPYYKNYIGGRWADISIPSLQAAMRYAFTHQEEVREKGENAYKKALGFSIENVGKLAKSLIFNS